MNYKLLKLLHISSLVTWLGPSTGGYYLIYLSRMSGQSRIEMWLRNEYTALVYIETFGLLLLIASGLGMLLTSKKTLIGQRWLKIKLFIVTSVFIPLEAIQLYIYHGLINNAFQTGTGIEHAILIFDRFSIAALAVLILTVPAVFWLAFLKPGADS
jgi:uncharacterized membrane protein